MLQATHPLHQTHSNLLEALVQWQPPWQPALQLLEYCLYVASAVMSLISLQKGTAVYFELFSCNARPSVLSLQSRRSSVNSPLVEGPELGLVRLTSGSVPDK